METYFAKYLPVNETAQISDTVFHKGAGILKVVERREENPAETALVVRNQYGITFSVEIADAPKVKLFLCSNEIKSGDKVYWTDPEGITSQFNTAIEVTDSELFLSELKASELGALPGECIHVIGEISPEAIWVKEGDEFEEGQIWNHYTCEKGTECDLLFGKQTCQAPHKIAKPIKIKCPGCGHFH